MINWSEYSIKKQFMIALPLLTIASLIYIGISCIIYINIAGNKINDNLYNGCLNIAEKEIKNILINGAEEFDNKLRMLSSSFTNIMTYYTENTFRNDFPYTFKKSHYNWPNQLENSLFNQNYNANITYRHSTYNIYNITYDNIYTVSNSLLNTINVTSIIDYVFPLAFNLSNDFFAGYYASNEQFLRYYPGAVNYNNINKYILYDNLNDLWYTSTLSDSKSPTYTSPYFDPIANNIMITIANKVRNPYTGEVNGAFGTDLILKTLQNDIKSLIYMNKSRTILFEKSGYVIADTNVDIIDKLYQYENSSITDELWIKLLNNYNKLVKYNRNYFLSTELETSNKNYILVSIIEEKHILDAFSKIINDYNKIIKNEITIVIIVFFVSLFLCILLSVLLAHKISTPLQKLIEISESLTKNIGEESLTKNVNMNIPLSGIDEIDRATTQFRETANYFGNRETNSTYEQNPMYNINYIPSVDYLNNVMPSAPPMEDISSDLRETSC